MNYKRGGVKKDSTAYAILLREASFLCSVIRTFVDMKRLAGVVTVLVGLAVTGCSRQQEYNRILAEADSVIEQHVDSAYCLLQRIPDVMSDGGEASRAYYTVLMAQAAYILYDTLNIPHDTLLRKAVSYYEQTDNRPMLCRALYYRSMPLYEQGRHDEALLLLKKGEELATENHDVLYMSKYHESLCMVNYMSKCYDLELKYAKLFLDDALLLKDTACIARGLSHVSVAYFKLDSSLVAKDYIGRVLSYLPLTDKVDKAYILTNFACICHRNGDISTAKHYLEQSLRQHPLYNTYAELGDIFADEGQWDEAEKNWQRALYTDNAAITINALSSMLSRYKQQNDWAKALAVSEQIYHLKDSLNLASEQAMIRELQYKYDTQVVENKHYKTLTWMFASILLALLIIAAILFFYRRTVKAYTSKLDNSLLTIQETRQQIEQLKNERQRQEELHGKSDERYNRKIDALKRKITDIHREAYGRIGRGKKVFEMVRENASIRLREDENCLADYYSVFYYETYNQWVQEYEGLSLRLITFLILQKIGKTDDEICQILSIEKGSVRSIKSRLNQQKLRGKTS